MKRICISSTDCTSGCGTIYRINGFLFPYGINPLVSVITVQFICDGGTKFLKYSETFSFFWGGLGVFIHRRSVIDTQALFPSSGVGNEPEWQTA